MCSIVSLTGVVALLVAVAALLGGPGIAGRLVEGSLATAGLRGTGTTVRVASDPPWELIGGHADRLEIDSEDVSFGQLQARRVELVLLDGELESRTVAGLEGRLDGVTLRTAGGSSIEAERVDLVGPPDAVEATIRIPAAEVERAALAGLEAQTGITGGSASLQAPDRLVFNLFLVRVEGRIVVEPDGALSMALNVPGSPRVGLVPADPLRFTSATVVDDALVLTGEIDLAGMAP